MKRFFYLPIYCKQAVDGLRLSLRLALIIAKRYFDAITITGMGAVFFGALSYFETTNKKLQALTCECIAALASNRLRIFLLLVKNRLKTF